jgi:hypothetical protein
MNSLSSVGRSVGRRRGIKGEEAFALATFERSFLYSAS